jgi:hypothetical protein
VSDLIQMVVREPGAQSVPAYTKRVHRLSVVYLVMFTASAVGLFMLVWRSRFLVTLTQRSNVETLVLVFFLVFFAYVGSLSAKGAYGGVRVLWWGALGKTHDVWKIERKKQAAMASGKDPEHPSAAMNLVVEREGRVGEEVVLEIADEAGQLGRIRIDGAEITLEATHRDGSNNVLNFVIEQVNEMMKPRRARRRLEVVEWNKISDEAAHEFLAHVEFARNLEKKLGGDPLWPRVILSDQDCRELERRLASLCPAIRSESFLPDWEYRGEHKLPIIPEPLGLISLSRSERRVDPEASMSAAAVVVVIAVAILAYIIMVPPWVPGA